MLLSWMVLHTRSDAPVRGLQAAQERGPERAVLAVADVHTQDFAVAVGPDADRDDHGVGDDPGGRLCLAVGTSVHCESLSSVVEVSLP